MPPKLAFLCPDHELEDFTCYSLLWPSDPVYVALLTGALLALCTPENWEQVEETDQTPEQCANQFALLLDEWLAHGTC